MSVRFPRQTVAAAAALGLDRAEPFPSLVTRRAGELLAERSQPMLISLTWALVLLVGAVDYLTGYEISLLLFYLLPVSLAVWFVSQRFAVLIALSSIGVWLTGDIVAGANYHNVGVVAWNVSIMLGFFLIVVWLLASLRRSVQDLEARVNQRTAALTDEMAERARLEIEILEISEREQRRIGHDLHDGLGQHLTGTALASRVAIDHLAARELHAEAEKVERVAGLISDAIELTRNLARGLSPVVVEVEGLSIALTELAESTVAQFYLPCAFEADPSLRVSDPVVATHLYRIAQEAITNAIRHGRAGSVHLALAREPEGGGLMLTIRDDGVGLPPPDQRRREGMGLRIMAHRARMIGATLDVVPGPKGGCVVRCRMDLPSSEATH